MQEPNGLQILVTIMVANKYVFLKLSKRLVFFFFLNDPATPEISPFPLHAPLPILPWGAGSGGIYGSGSSRRSRPRPACAARRRTSSRSPGSTRVRARVVVCTRAASHTVPTGFSGVRSEEHTSELQSQSNLVCRRLLEKKK